MPKVSVIVPVYRVEKYICSCVESILSQSFSDFELILVDDGSPDKCGEICDEYAKRDNRVKVYHKQNGGVSSARNLGIENAKGEWLCFIDGDDRVEPTYLEDFKLCESHELYVQGYVEVSPNGEIIRIHKAETEETNLADILAELENKIIINSPCFKLYNRNIIKNNQIRFDENLSLGEDHIFSLTYYFFVNTVDISKRTGYIVNRGIENSLTHRVVPLRELSYYNICFRELQDKLIDKFSDTNYVLRKAFNVRNYILLRRTLTDIKIRGLKRTELSEFKRCFLFNRSVITIGLPIKHKCTINILFWMPTFFIKVLFLLFGGIILKIIR